MRSAILEIRTTDPRRALTLLRHALGNDAVSLFGDKIHAETSDPRQIRVAAKSPSSGRRHRDRLPRTSQAHARRCLRIDAGRHPRGAEAMSNSSSDKAVIAKDLERRFGKFVAVNRVSFEVRKGEIFGFLGPNGAGKSTTIRMLCGILAPTGGQGTVAGYDLATPDRGDKVPHRLHEPEVLSLRRPHRRRERGFLQRHLPHPSREETGAQELGHRNGGPRRKAQHANRAPLRRLETAPCPRLRHPPRASRHLPR